MLVDLITTLEDQAKFSRLVNRAFPVPPQGNFLEDFPVWDPRYSPSGGGCVRLGAFAPGETRELAACTGVRLARYPAPVRDLTVAVIGAVATDAVHRGRGLASGLVDAALQWAQSHGACFALLWGSEHGLYRRLGFELCGEQAVLPASAWAFRSMNHPTVQTGWTAALFDLVRRERKGGFVLEEADRDWLGAHRNTQWFWTGSPESPTAYAALGRGIDLQGYVHEWGGDSGDLEALLRQVARRHPEASLLGSTRLFRERGWPAEAATREFLCMARVLDLESLLNSWTGPEAGGRRLREYQMIRDRDGLPALAQAVFGGGETPRFPLWVWGLDAA